MFSLTDGCGSLTFEDSTLSILMHHVPRDGIFDICSSLKKKIFDFLRIQGMSEVAV